jgi:hypothetical protein
MRKVAAMWAIHQRKTAQPNKMMAVLGALFAKAKIADDQEVLRVDRGLVVERGEIEAVVLVEAVEKMHVKRVEAVRVLGQGILERNVRTGRIRRPGKRQRGQKSCFANNGKTQMI